MPFSLFVKSALSQPLQLLHFTSPSLPSNGSALQAFLATACLHLHADADVLSWRSGLRCWFARRHGCDAEV